MFHHCGVLAALPDSLTRQHLHLGVPAELIRVLVEALVTASAGVS